MDKFAYSLNGQVFDCYQFDSRADAEVEGREAAEDMGEPVFYVGRVISFKFSDFCPSIDVILEHAEEIAFDAAGASVGDWPTDISDEADREFTARFRKMVDDWATQFNCHPKFFSVDQVQEHRVTPIPF
jgi:hypothetical protein